MNDLGKWLKWKMEERQLTLNATAEYSGVSAAVLSDILNRDNYSPKKEILVKLARYFKVNPFTLIEMTGVATDTELMDYAGLPPEWEPRVKDVMAKINALPEPRRGRMLGVIHLLLDEPDIPIPPTEHGDTN